LLQFAPTKDEITTIQTVDIKPILDASNSKRDVIERSVCRLFGVHPVLCGYSDAAVLGNTQAIANASLELNKVANPFQRLMTDAFRQLYPNVEWEIFIYIKKNTIPTISNVKAFSPTFSNTIFYLLFFLNSILRVPLSTTKK